MGIHWLLAERITSSSSGNMLRFLTLAAALALAAGMGMDEKKIMKDMMEFNSMAACWGKGNMYLYKLALLEATEQCTQQDHHNLLKPTEEDFREFLEDFEEFKGDIATKMGNLTCVMQKLNMLDSNLQVDMAQYTTDVWNKIDLSQTMAGEDPEWRNMLTTHYKDCYDIARSFPQSALNRNPLTKVFGRHMVFFKCAKKVEHKCCAMA